MIIKKVIKRIGRIFIAVRPENETNIRQSILVIDNGYCGFGQWNPAIEKIRKYFPHGEISVLTSEERKNNLQRGFPGLNYVIHSQRLMPRRYRIALQAIGMRKKRYDYIVLFSLDISPLVASLAFLRPKKVILYNQWGQWWYLSLRNAAGFFKTAYVRKRSTVSLKKFIKKLGRFFVSLYEAKEDILRHSILIIDNGASFAQAEDIIRRIKELLPEAIISLLTLEKKEKLTERFQGLKIIKPSGCIIRKYCLARHVLRLRNNKYDYVVLLSLDITPIIALILFMKSKVLVYNQWHQWWLIEPKSIRNYLMAMTKFILYTVVNIMVFIYLLISVFWIFLKKSFRIFQDNLLIGKGSQYYGN